jgi:predicted DNA-binding WGR domain protein
MKVIFIGWCNDPVDNHDKVWGIALKSDHSFYGKQNDYATFWGRRGKKLQKKVVTMWPKDVSRLIGTKRNKGYIQVPEDQVNDVYNRFAKDLFKIALSV